MKLSLLIFSILYQLCETIELKIYDDLLEVRSQTGVFHPLCSESFSHKYGEQACATLSNTFSTYSIVQLDQYTYSIGCTSSVCFTFLSSFCKTGVKVYCSSSLCSEGTVQVGTKCISISTIPVKGYNEAKEYCSPFSLVSSLKPSEIESISDILMPLNSDNSRIYYISGLRKGSKWEWENGDDINDKMISGNGRCLSLQNGQLYAIDCDKNGYVICEKGRECISKNNNYNGIWNRTTKGYNCLRWDDPSVLFQKQSKSEIYPHNYCRFVTDEHNKVSITPMCYIKPGQLDSCNIPNCPESFNDETRNDETCPIDAFSCDNNSKCISDKFKCDYEVDCSDGTDELNCEDYLQNYELIGAYRLADNIIEVWTFIPHVQGCARKCRESLLMCEAFSYEPKSQTCLLTDTSHKYSSLAQRTTSLYYRRRFSTKDVTFEITDNILYATKSNINGRVCNDNYSREKLSSICRVLGFGASLFAESVRLPIDTPVQVPYASRLSSLASDTRPPPSIVTSTTSSVVVSQVSVSKHSSSSFLSSHPYPIPSKSWRLSCLRDSSCNETSLASCQPIRCSNCKEAVCSDGKCIRNEQLCDGIKDCINGDDELECRATSFRLANGTDTNGYVQVLFRGSWEPVCLQNLTKTMVNSICESMRLGEQGNILSSDKVIKTGWSIECNVDCKVQRADGCQQQARISCISEHGESSGSQCGIRYVEVNARDAARARVARVVGGFETVAGAFPWTASMRIKASKAHHCGASILDRTHLITAAHCFEEDERVDSYELIVGDWDNNSTDGTEQIFDLKRIHFYPLYKDIFSHDIAILEISHPGITFNSYVQPICLPSRDFVYTPGRQCVVSGWGSIGLRYPTRLQAALIPIIDRSDCVNSSQIYQSMSRSAFCAGYLDGGIDSCQGDSGGPFACRRPDGAFVLAGVISWGDGCAQKKQPGIYTMVAPYLSWIYSVMNGGE